jgi:hypothetical protein
VIDSTGSVLQTLTAHLTVPVQKNGEKIINIFFSPKFLNTCQNILGGDASGARLSPVITGRQQFGYAGGAQRQSVLKYHQQPILPDSLYRASQPELTPRLSCIPRYASQAVLRNCCLCPLLSFYHTHLLSLFRSDDIECEVSHLLWFCSDEEYDGSWPVCG